MGELKSPGVRRTEESIELLDAVSQKPPRATMGPIRPGLPGFTECLCGVARLPVYKGGHFYCYLKLSRPKQCASIDNTRPWTASYNFCFAPTCSCHEAGNLIR